MSASDQQEQHHFADYGTTTPTGNLEDVEDEIIPVRFWDEYYATFILHTGFRFDTKLDPDKLRTSLEKLMEDRHRGWHRLGGRLRRNKDSDRLEYHVPAAYSRDHRPAFSYHVTSTHGDTSIGQHPLASCIPSSTSSMVDDGKPQFVGPIDGVIRGLLRAPDEPTFLDDYLDPEQDCPLLALHVVTFSDATLISVCFSHAVLDATGLSDLMRAWSLVLQGRDNKVPRLVEHTAEGLDPLSLLDGSCAKSELQMGENPEEEYKCSDKQLGIGQLLLLRIRLVIQRLWQRFFDPETRYDGQRETRTVRVPVAFIESLRQQILTEAKSAPSFVSQGDVLYAWWARHIVTARIPDAGTSNQTIGLVNAMNLRRMLKLEGFLKEDEIFAGNALAIIQAFMPAKELASGPLGQAAATLRKALKELGTLSQVKALLTLQRRALDGGNNKGSKMNWTRFVMFGDAGMDLIVCSNWTQAALFELDMSGAAMKPTGLARPTNVMVDTTFPLRVGALFPSGFTILGKDSEHSSYWIQSRMRREVWDKIEETGFLPT